MKGGACGSRDQDGPMCQGHSEIEAASDRLTGGESRRGTKSAMLHIRYPSICSRDGTSESFKPLGYPVHTDR